MIIRMTNFHYYFSLKGSEGGLFSMECTFRLAPEKGETPADVKTAMRDLVQTHTQLLDGLYRDLIPGNREPVLTDSPHAISTGYRYSGKLTKRGMRRAAARLAAMFGDAAVDPRGGHSPFRELRVEIECTARKAAAGFDNVSISAKYEMDHTLNVCFFRFIKSLEGIEVSDESRRHMEALDRMLASNWERDGIDHYRTMLTSE